MKKHLLTLILTLFFANNVSAKEIFLDKYANKIVLEKDKNEFDNEKKKLLLYNAFYEAYKDFLPHEIDASYKDCTQVKQFIISTFDNEFSELDKKTNILIYIAKNKKNDELVGIVILESNLTHLYIRHMAIAPAYQRRGIGKELIRYIIKNNVDSYKILADTRKTNTKACDFYKSLGFTPLNEPVIEKLSKDKYCGFSMILQ